MTTTWTGSPVLSAASINELRTAVYEAGGSPPEWTDGAQLPASATLKAVYATEIRDAIQRLWNDRGLGLILNWTTGVEPGEPNPTTPVPLQESDITDLRKWFDHYETWGDLRGVHWWKDTSTDFTGILWNVESVIALTTDPDANGNTSYNVNHVNEIHGYCRAARNHGLVNIVRLDWKKGQAVPTAGEGYATWTERFTSAVNKLKDVATIFIVGNEPDIEGGLTGRQYATAFNHLYGRKVTGTKYLAAGPSLFAVLGSGDDREVDTKWLENASNAINEGQLDGWALHTYGAPYLDYAGPTDDSNQLCSTATIDCPIERDKYKTEGLLVGDAGFRRYSNLINKIRGRWPRKPVYLTETNTSGYKAEYENVDPEDTSKKAPPSETYVTGWIQTSYNEIRNFNRENNVERNSWPPILCLCWFVDSDRDPRWVDFALSNTAEDKLLQARNDFKASLTYTGVDPNNPYSNLAPSPIVEHQAGTRLLSGTVL